jgi:hypothetical protein
VHDTASREPLANEDKKKKPPASTGTFVPVPVPQHIAVHTKWSTLRTWVVEALAAYHAIELASVLDQGPKQQDSSGDVDVDDDSALASLVAEADESIAASITALVRMMDAKLFDKIASGISDNHLFAKMTSNDVRLHDRFTKIMQSIHINLQETSDSELCKLLRLPDDSPPTSTSQVFSSIVSDIGEVVWAAFPHEHIRAARHLHEVVQCSIQVHGVESNLISDLLAQYKVLQPVAKVWPTINELEAFLSLRTLYMVATLEELHKVLSSRLQGKSETSPLVAGEACRHLEGGGGRGEGSGVRMS